MALAISVIVHHCARAFPPSMPPGHFAGRHEHHTPMVYHVGGELLSLTVWLQVAALSGYGTRRILNAYIP